MFIKTKAHYKISKVNEQEKLKEYDRKKGTLVDFNPKTAYTKEKNFLIVK